MYRELFLLIIKLLMHIIFKLCRVYKANMKHLPVERLDTMPLFSGDNRDSIFIGLGQLEM